MPFYTLNNKNVPATVKVPEKVKLGYKLLMTNHFINLEMVIEVLIHWPLNNVLKLHHLPVNPIYSIDKSYVQ